VHALLEIENRDTLLGHPVAGASWEGLIVEQLLSVAAGHYKAYFYRTADGAEIDLVLARVGTPEIAIEIKRSSAPSLERGFSVACDDLGIGKRFVVYPCNERFPLRHGAQALGLSEMMGLLMRA
jgi:predicted AAA+ superfamily ATPase